MRAVAVGDAVEQVGAEGVAVFVEEAGDVVHDFAGVVHNAKILDVAALGLDVDALGFAVVGVELAEARDRKSVV